jgi:hypothetical protein
MSINLHISPIGLVSKLAKEVVVVHDWLAGPPMSEHDRVVRDIAEGRDWRHLR